MDNSQVIILMATCNGSRFISAQLESIAKQEHNFWKLIVSDDHSDDGTLHILHDFARLRQEGQVQILQGPGRGATENFRSLLRRNELKNSYLAFCDQDDVWEAHHLSRALKALKDFSGQLAIYGSRLRICDKELNQFALSPLPRRPLSFRNALMQNMISGNTMVMTPKAAELVQISEREAGSFPVHDWWAFQLVTGAGGAIVFDEQPAVFYRIHGDNVIGWQQGWRKLPARISRHWRGSHRQWAHDSVLALSASSNRLTPQNRKILDTFGVALDTPYPLRFLALHRSGVYYQSRKAQFAFWVSAALGRR